MAIQIPPNYTYIQQAVAYPEEEWLWRGIVDPNIFFSTNMCWNVLTLLIGTEYGHNLAVAADYIEPKYTSDGTLIYRATFDTTSGLFIYSFGLAGNEALINSSLIILNYLGNKLDLQWDAINLDYRGTDIAVANSMALKVGTEVCIASTVVPDLFIKYDYITEG